VRFQSYHDDLTAAQIEVDDGSVQMIPASIVGTRGPYDVWEATVPATAADSLSYFIAVTDGGDTDYIGPQGISDAPPSGGWLIDYALLSHAPLGGTLTSGGGAVFKVWAPTRSTCYVRGDFNSWGLTNLMHKVGPYFIELVSTASARQQYKYYFNNSVWNADARARGLDPSNNLNSYLEDPESYSWTIEDFATPSLDQMVIYQLHVGTWAGYNDPYGGTTFPARYVDVAARAAQLADLGVNAVMLNPITEFAGDVSAGYNPISQYAPEWKYGTPNQFKYMVDTLHQYGIAVILDVVWNHVSATDNYLWNYDGSQIYFDTPAVDTPWGSQADFDASEVRSYYLDSALMWFEEYKIDGFRMDATDYMKNGVQGASGWTLMVDLNNEIQQRYAGKVMIAEQLPDDAAITKPTALGGAGFDTQYYDYFTDNLRAELLTAALGDPQMYVIRNIINGGGAYLSGGSVLNYLELHDEAWSESGGQRFVTLVDTTAPHDDQYAKGRSKLGEGLVLLAPGVPAILQGTEWLEDIGWGPNYADRIDWSKKTTYSGIFAYYRDLIALRETNPALRSGASWQVFHLNESGNVIAFQRYDNDGNVVVCVANFSNTDYGSYRVGLPLSGRWKVAVHSQDTKYEGAGQTNPEYFDAETTSSDIFAQSVALDLPAMALVALAKVSDATAAPALEGAREQSRAWFESSYPNPTAGNTSLKYHLVRRSSVEIRIYDLAGRLVRTLASGSQAAGIHTTSWDGRDSEGASVASGVYFAKLAAAGVVDTQRLVLVR
jgi:1,4-alpha-glucan branching enzyme